MEHNNINLFKRVMNPERVISELDRAKKEGKYKYLSVFNVRNNKEVYALHSAKYNYLLRATPEIHCLDRRKTTQALFKINEIIRESRYLVFEIKKEGEQNDRNKTYAA